MLTLIWICTVPQRVAAGSPVNVPDVLLPEPVEGVVVVAFGAGVVTVPDEPSSPPESSPPPPVPDVVVGLGVWVELLLVCGRAAPTAAEAVGVPLFVLVR
ncbi:hypothetical protein GCM10009657_00630 [Oryzihumus leptocrescens]